MGKPGAKNADDQESKPAIEAVVDKKSLVNLFDAAQRTESRKGFYLT